jgi:hypothetical protein
VSKAESLFVANLKPFFDSIGQPEKTSRRVRVSGMAPIADDGGKSIL